MFEQEVGAEFPSWLDVEQGWTEELRGSTRAVALPMSYVVREGRIVAVHTGPFEDEREVLDQLDAF